MDTPRLTYNELLNIVPAKKQSLIKSLLAGFKTLEVVDNRKKTWMYRRASDTVVYVDFSKTFKYPAEGFEDKLSPTMQVLGDLVVFIEHKGIEGWAHPVVTLLTLDKGYSKFY